MEKKLGSPLTPHALALVNNSVTSWIIGLEGYNTRGQVGKDEEGVYNRVVYVCVCVCVCRCGRLGRLPFCICSHNASRHSAT